MQEVRKHNIRVTALTLVMLQQIWLKGLKLTDGNPLQCKPKIWLN
jgi:hypothetical protein